MQTEFTLEQLADSDTAESEKILRACVHCGFCTATCPTYVLLGDELDGPRGRIYLLKNMLESGAAPEAETVKHIDRCLSCLSCMTTCPSGVNYMHLVDHGRRWIERHYRRPFGERLLRRMLGAVLSRPGLFRPALLAAAWVKRLAPLAPSRLRPLLELAPANVPAPSAYDRTQVFPSETARRMRVALLPGCAQRVLAPELNAATIRLLTRHGADVVMAPGSGCCGSLTHHLGDDERALAFARANIDAWERARASEGLDAIVVNASGCGTTVKDYGFLFRDDPAYAEKAARVSGQARDIAEIMTELGLGPVAAPTGLRVAYHSACSLQHGQKIHREPKSLLAAAGFDPIDIPEGHLCCGSAGTYNLLQPELASRLRARKIAHIKTTGAELVATGNIGCITQLAGNGVPVLHTVELLDWATGGPIPLALAGSARAAGR
jgi:glycolate oxidase iron-sulfur subunit